VNHLSKPELITTGRFDVIRTTR